MGFKVQRQDNSDRVISAVQRERRPKGPKGKTGQEGSNLKDVAQIAISLRNSTQTPGDLRYPSH